MLTNIMKINFNSLCFQQSQISEIIPAILSAEVVIAASNDWRLQEEIITHFVCFQHLTNSDNIYHKIIPVLLIKLKRAVSTFSLANFVFEMSPFSQAF